MGCKMTQQHVASSCLRHNITYLCDLKEHQFQVKKMRHGSVDSIVDLKQELDEVKGCSEYGSACICMCLELNLSFLFF
jgi:hypothetical protein